MIFEKGETLMHRKKKPLCYSLIFSIALLSIALFPVGTQAQTFNSQSNGTDGALDFSWAVPATGTRTVIFDPSDPATFDPANPARRLDADNDNIFHFTTIFIPSNVTVVLSAPKLNWAPVYWLATGDVVIERFATLDLSGQAGHAWDAVGNERFPAFPGPGGFSGGLGASSFHLAQPGFGPGGGTPRSCDCGGGGHASHATLGVVNSFTGATGSIYGSPYLLPLVGGSGGAGDGDGGTLHTSNWYGGGAGGGAILIASNTQILHEGFILAKGGKGGRRNFSQGGGSGGAVRLLVPTIKGTGSIDVRSSGNGGSGRIRIETAINEYLGTLLPSEVTSTRISVLVPDTPFLPGVHPIVPLWPSIHVASVNGITVNQEPSASFAFPDATVPTSEPVTVVFNTKNIPTNASLTFHITSNEAAVLKVSPTFISGTKADATWQGTASFPLGFSRGYLQATWAPPAP